MLDSGLPKKAGRTGYRATCLCANATQLEGCYAQELETTWEMQCPESEHRELAKGAPHDPQPPRPQDSNTLNKIHVMIN